MPRKATAAPKRRTSASSDPPVEASKKPKLADNSLPQSESSTADSFTNVATPIVSANLPYNASIIPLLSVPRYETSGEHVHADDFASPDIPSPFWCEPIPVQRRPESQTTNDRGLLQQFEDLFLYNHRPFTKSDDHTPSTDTRAPKLFDLHLRKDLRLRDVKFSPSLVTELVSHTQDRFALLRSMGCFDNRPLSHALEPTGADNTFSTDVHNESHMALMAKHLIFNPCQAAASFLVLGVLPESVDASVLETKDVMGRTQGNANPDFILVLEDVKQQNPHLAPLIDLLSVRSVATSGRRPLAVIEAKSLLSGDKDVLNQVVFSPFKGWITCGTMIDGTKYSCGSHAALGGIDYVSGKDLTPSPDAQLFKTEEQSPDSSLPGATTENTMDEAESQISDSDYISSQHEDEDECHSQDVLGKPRESAMKIRQQVWAQLVDSDTTFAIITSGNHMAIGFRDRATRTLYLSPVFSINEAGSPPFGLILTSVFVAALQDSIERVRSLVQVQPAVKPTLTLDTSKKLRMRKQHFKELETAVRLHIRIDHHLPPPILQRSIYWATLTRLRPIASKSSGILEGQDETSGSDTEREDGSKKDDDGDGDTGEDSGKDSGEESGDDDLSDSDSNSGKTVEIFGLVGKEQAKACASKIFFVQPRSTSGRDFSNTLIVKLATTKSEMDSLEKEYQWYMALTGKIKCLLPVYGLFEYRISLGSSGNERCRYTLLLMDHGGDPLSNNFSLGKSSQRALPDNVTMYLDALTQFHRLGYLHNRVVPSHFLVPKTRKERGKTQGQPKKKTQVFMIGLAEVSQTKPHNSNSCKDGCVPGKNGARCATALKANEERQRLQILFRRKK